jgi:hypothetical protein
MAKDIGGVDPNVSNPNNPGDKNQAPVDPSNTSDVGQRIEQGVVDTKKGISEQSSEWEDRQERTIPHPATPDRAENYLKDPSPEEMNIEEEQNGE